MNVIDLAAPGATDPKLVPRLLDGASPDPRGAVGRAWLNTWNTGARATPCTGYCNDTIDELKFDVYVRVRVLLNVPAHVGVNVSRIREHDVEVADVTIETVSVELPEREATKVPVLTLATINSLEAEPSNVSVTSLVPAARVADDERAGTRGDPPKSPGWHNAGFEAQAFE